MKGFLCLLVAITLPAAFAGPIAAPLPGTFPGPGASRIYLFASPNQRESLTDKEAQARLASFEQINADAVADRAACALTHSVQIADSLGVYDMSSENSFLVEAELEQKQSEYLAALLGLYQRQEFILLFFDDPGGHNRLWIIQTPQSLQAVLSALRKSKLTPVTVRIEKEETEVWFVDLGEKHAALLKDFASEVDGRATLTAGVAELLGNPDRTSAVKLWQQKIRGYEEQSASRLSAQLSSKAWRHATTVHTCSTPISIP